MNSCYLWSQCHSTYLNGYKLICNNKLGLEKIKIIGWLWLCLFYCILSIVCIISQWGIDERAVLPSYPPMTTSFPSSMTAAKLLRPCNMEDMGYQQRVRLLYRSATQNNIALNIWYTKCVHNITEAHMCTFVMRGTFHIFLNVWILQDLKFCHLFLFLVTTQLLFLAISFYF